MFARSAMALAALAAAGAVAYAASSSKAHLAAVLSVAEQSPESRWYSLEELGLGGFPKQLDASLRMGPPARNAGSLVPIADDQGDVWLTQGTTILRRTERWEYGSGSDTLNHVGYPSVVYDEGGATRQPRIYLFYAIHDVPSGIGLARSPNPTRDFAKLAESDPLRIDSRVLVAPLRPRGTSHYSSPVVLWDDTTQHWFMYFHYYSNEFDRGRGHQRTALARTADLDSNDWRIHADEQGRIVSVLPTSASRWMNSQSTYHAIVRLQGPLWVAFLRGVGGEIDASGAWQQDPARLGFAVSRDGIRWAEVPGNPRITPSLAGATGKTGVFRPLFLAVVNNALLACWSESEHYDHSPSAHCATTADLQNFRPIPMKIHGLEFADGPASALALGQSIYLYQGSSVYRVEARPPSGK